jgi:hypothetical protein
VNGDWRAGNFETLGCSYCFNGFFWGNSTIQPLDDVYMLSGKKESYVKCPSRMILMYEPPAMWYYNYYHWHYARGPTTVAWAQPNFDTQKYISPIAFGDGHTGVFDYGPALRDPNGNVLEPTKDWYWYEPGP